MVKIRLARVGNTNKRKYRIVVADEQKAATSKFLEVIGTFDQTVKPSLINLDKDKYESWLSKGAQPTPTVYKLASSI